MNAELWREVEQLYHAALEKDPAQRGAFVAERAVSEEVRREVASLLAQSDCGDGPLDHPAWEDTRVAQDHAHAQIEAGLQIGPYRIEALLGAGGMGVVYRARDTRLNRFVAIKFLADISASAAARARFQREARLASGLNHPHILTVYDAGEFDGRDYLVTEFIDGGTLRDWCRERRTWRQIVELAAGVADGLAAAHGAGILHRDVKPANILASSTGYAKLADFGLARLGEETPAASGVFGDEARTLPGAILGTVSYMSPEQAAGRSVDARSDIFSFGVVLYEMLAGRRPFAAPIDFDDAGTPHPLPEHLPASLRMAVEKALEKDPNDRYQSMREMVVDLKRTLRLNSAGVIQERSPKRVLPRTGLALKIGAATAVVIAAGVLWLLWQRDYFWSNPLAGARFERVTDFDGDETDAAISPDGKFIAFLSDRDGSYDAWVSHIGSAEFVNISKRQFPRLEPGVIRKLSFSADSAHVQFLQGWGNGPYTAWLSSPVGGTPRSFIAGALELVWSADGKRVAWHTMDPGDPIYIADREGSNPRRIHAEPPGGHCHYLSWSPDGRFIYFVKGVVTTDEMDIWRISTSETSARPERITSHHARVGYSAFLDNRTLIYSATAENGSGQSLYTMDVERRIADRVTSGISEQYLSVAASATRPRRLVTTVANPSASLWTIPLSDGTQTEAAASRLPVPNSRALAPRFGAGYLLFLSSRGGGDALWKLDNAGTARELWRGRDGSVVAPPAVSPDGNLICFSFWSRGRAGLYLMNADGTNIRPLANTLDVRSAVSWSPDGKAVAAAATLTEGTRVFVIPVDGGAPVRMVEGPSYTPVWSPGGEYLVYSEPVSGSTFAVKAITRKKSPVVIPRITVPYTAASPYRFVPGRKTLVFLNDGPFRRRNFYSVDLETGRQRQLTDLKAGTLIQSFDVSPDGKQIIFDRLRENADVVLIDLAR